MKHTIVTTGQAFADIDAVACVIAYAELLRLESRTAEAYFPGALNNSVTRTIRAWGLDYVSTPSTTDAEFVVMDVSEPQYIAHAATAGTIAEVYDHHPGFETYWQEKLGEHSHIEPIGACATLVWEEYEKRGKADDISQLSARLLAVAILSNTLNFGAVITDERDRRAFATLWKRGGLPDNWIADYFAEQEEAVTGDVVQTIIDDTKVFRIPTVPFPFTIGQLELWAGEAFLKKESEQVKRALESFGHPHWIMSVPSLSERRNHFYCENAELKSVFERGLGVKFEGDYASSDRLWLRKEILKAFSKKSEYVG
ncbi:MAG: DHH family phosphoesterase [Candidatus Moraniibacteriota bacterium]